MTQTEPSRERGQLILPIDFTPVYGFDNFVVCLGNQQAYLAIRDFMKRSSDARVLFLYGPSGTGKTHLLNALQSFSEKDNPGRETVVVSCQPGEFTGSSDTSIPGSGIQSPGLLFIEDVHHLASIQGGEDNVFSLFNAFFNRGGDIIVTSREHASLLHGLHDRLTSRFLCGTTIQIGLLDEITCTEILKKLATDRQIELTDKVVSYLILRVPRNPASLFAIFNDIDKQALKAKKPITIPLVRSVLEHAGLDDITGM